LLVRVTQQELHSGTTPRGKLNMRSGKVARHTAAIEMLKGIEAIRNILKTSLDSSGDSEEEAGRAQFLSLFGGDCSRIARTHAVLMSVMSQQSLAAHFDDRVPQCLEACESVEKILQDLGFAAKLKAAKESETQDLYLKTHAEKPKEGLLDGVASAAAATMDSFLALVGTPIDTPRRKPRSKPPSQESSRSTWSRDQKQNPNEGGLTGRSDPALTSRSYCASIKEDDEEEDTVKPPLVESPGGWASSWQAGILAGLRQQSPTEQPAKESYCIDGETIHLTSGGETDRKMHLEEEDASPDALSRRQEMTASARAQEEWDEMDPMAKLAAQFTGLHVSLGSAGFVCVIIL